MKAEHFDTIVIGGGPGGSTAATFIAMQGHKVLLLQRRVEGCELRPQERRDVSLGTQPDPVDFRLRPIIPHARADLLRLSG
jgi:choline dehydrogenase-like flavoprotein